MQQEKLTKGIFFGLIGNLLFVAFGLICLFYYYTYSCLLYTSDAADELDGVDLGGRGGI